MQRIVTFIAKNLFSIVGVTLLTGATVSTGVMGVAKVANNFGPSQLRVPVQQTAESSSVTVLASPTPTITVKKTAPAVIRTASTPSGSSSQITTRKCIITLFGNSYDVTSLQDVHSGGNVFVCGSDQSALYQSRHGTDVSRMKLYLITTGTTGSATSAPAPKTGQQHGKSKDKADRDQDREEEEQVHQESRLPLIFSNLI